MNIEDSELGLDFLSQFDTADAKSASYLLSQFITVSTGQMRQWLAGQVAAHSSSTAPLALYAERELTRGARFFSRIKPGSVRRAIGRQGPPLVHPLRGIAQVGSEGIIAQLLSELSRREPRRYLLSPGPDSLRPASSRAGIRTLAIVTDVVGSGARICRMLDALHRTESFRSWRSHRNVRPQIVIISYAATVEGLQAVREHRLEPRVDVRTIVPTIASVAIKNGRAIWELEALCQRYDPAKNEGSGDGDGSDAIGSLGYRNVGTLLVFGHGCPNTTPRMFWRKKGLWKPLFLNRSAVSFDVLFSKARIIRFAEELKSFGQAVLSSPAALSRFRDEAVQALLVLSAVEHGLHDSIRIAVRTGLDVGVIEQLLTAFSTAGWIDLKNCITESGLAELRSARRVAPKRILVPEDPISVYFPNSLQG